MEREGDMKEEESLVRCGVVTRGVKGTSFRMMTEMPFGRCENGHHRIKSI